MVAMNGNLQTAASDRTGKRILVIVSEMGHPAQCKIRGISAYARRAGWVVSLVEGRHTGSRPDFAKWIDMWQPNGLVVDSEYMADILALDPAIRPPVAFGDVASESPLPAGCARVVSDATDIAATAARELLRTGFPHFAFVPSVGDKPWSHRRAEAFENEMKGVGRDVARYRPAPTAADDAVRFRKGLARFLRQLPKPCGVFAANDATAALVASGCAECGLAIPDDIAIVGVDDHEEYCENARATITSIRLDFERCGVATAELLDAMMRAHAQGRAAGGGSVVATYGVEKLVRRASTSVLRVRDGRVSRALEWIRLHATTPIDVGDVVVEMGCSRSLADLRFRQATGRSILDEIHSRRLELAMELLKRGDVPIDEIPERCGYVRGPYLGILFKRATGLTMRRWRAEWRRGTSAAPSCGRGSRVEA